MVISVVRLTRSPSPTRVSSVTVRMNLPVKILDSFLPPPSSLCAPSCNSSLVASNWVYYSTSSGNQQLVCASSGRPAVWSERINPPRTLLHVDLKRIDVPELTLQRDNNNQLEILGAGTYGTVFKGHLVGTLGPVVLKRISLGNVTSHAVHNEARITVHLHATGVVPRMHGVTEPVGKFLCLVQEFIPGMTLHNLLYKRFNDVNTKGWLTICYKLTTGLISIHQRLVCHNDIKTDNVIVGFHDGNIKVHYIDFGLATYMYSRTSHILPGEAHKYPFRAPEVKAGQQNSQASDVYSLGYMFYQIWKMGITELCQIAMICTMTDHCDRPRLADVAAELEDLLGELGD